MQGPATGPLGNRGDAAATTDTGTFSLIALVKRLLQRLTSGAWFISIFEAAITPTATTATLINTTLIKQPAAGKKLRLWWYNLSADPNNGAHVVAGLRFTIGGTDFYRVALSQYGAATAHSFKSGRSYFEGAVDEGLYVNLSAAQTVYCNIDSEDVAP